MTETLVVVDPPSQNPELRPPSAAELDAARELVQLARERGVALTGPDGLLKALTKTVIETALDEEMTDHLGYDNHDPGRPRQRELPQRHSQQDGADRRGRAGADRGSSGPARHVRTAAGEEAAAPPVRRR